MPGLAITAGAESAAHLAEGLARIRTRLEVPDDFPPDVLAAAERAATAPRLPDLDLTNLELVTIDPPGARDLDQALHIARDGAGFVVSYAIADVAAYVSAGDPVDLEAHRRGLTRYAPDRRTPLHPPALSEDAASLLPDQVRPALLWTIAMDSDGMPTRAEVVRARVRSRAQLSYEQAQAEIDGGSARETLALLAEVGPLREQAERDQGGVSLDIPAQEVAVVDGDWRLAYRATLPVEGWNAQISLLTGMSAARLMLDGQVGVLRTLPPADAGAVRRLRRTAKALRIAWPADRGYPDFVRSLDPSRPAEAAMLNACTSLFRGAAYVAFDGEVPAAPQHAALATAYAHATAPLRRLVDRYTGEICLALCAGTPVPDWVRAALPELPQEMASAEQRSKAYERAVVDLIEVFVLADRVGETMIGTVIDVDDDGRDGKIMIADPAVEARLRGDHLPLGEEITARLTSADWERGAVEFTSLQGK